MQSVIVLKSFIKQIKLLMVTMELTSSEWNFITLLLNFITLVNRRIRICFEQKYCMYCKFILNLSQKKFLQDLFMSFELWPTWPNMTYVIWQAMLQRILKIEFLLNLSKKIQEQGLFNNYVKLKVAIFDHSPPLVTHRNKSSTTRPSCYKNFES